MKENKEKFKTSIGGQALMEGIMMRGPERISIAVRKPDGNIHIKEEELNTLAMRYKILGFPFIRGIVGLVESMIIGVNALMYSAEFFEDDFKEEEEEGIIDKIFKDKSEDVYMLITLVSSFLLAVGLFMILPNIITSFFRSFIKSDIGMNIIEGIIRVSIFFVYVLMVTRLDDIRRTFEYHGAEHKCIHCYESGEELTVENVKKHSILHPRCGTSFLFMVMIISIFVLSFFGWPNPTKRILIRIFMFPIIAGISYEVNRLIGRSNSKLAYYLSYPGLIIQKMATVKEPDDDQIEVAISALKRVIPKEKGEDKW